MTIIKIQLVMGIKGTFDGTKLEIKGNIGTEWNATMIGIKGDIIGDKNSIDDGNQRNL